MVRAWGSRDTSIATGHVLLGRGKRLKCSGHDVRKLRSFALTHVTAGEKARLRHHKANASRAKRCDVFLRYRISPHVDVHGSCYKHRAVRGKQRSREAVICNSRCHLSQHVSGCGNNHHKVIQPTREDAEWESPGRHRGRPPRDGRRAPRTWGCPQSAPHLPS